ncbi:MAG: hypothetical protein KQA40_02805 [Candidatus Aenigmarchaeota archaeon]|nr:hypothetical protein [Candidatus Aenigmarchaeota archaeon]
MKGIELPINLIVIIAIALIALIGVVFLLSGALSTSGSTVSLQAATSQGCQELIRSGKCGEVMKIFEIQIKDFDANKNGKINDPIFIQGPHGEPVIDPGADGLGMLCKNYYNCYSCAIGTQSFNEEACFECCNKKVCKCPAL